MPNQTSRITIAGGITHQNPGLNPLNFSLNGSMNLRDPAEETWIRQPPAGAPLDGWAELDLGWVKSPRMVVIKNLGSVYLSVGYGPDPSDPWLVPPGMPTILYPLAGKPLVIRGGGPYVLMAVQEIRDAALCAN